MAITNRSHNRRRNEAISTIYGLSNTSAIDEMTKLLSNFHFIEVWELTLSVVNLHICLVCEDCRWLFPTRFFAVVTWQFFVRFSFFSSSPITALVSACLWSYNECSYSVVGRFFSFLSYIRYDGDEMVMRSTADLNLPLHLVHALKTQQQQNSTKKKKKKKNSRRRQQQQLYNAYEQKV